MFRLILFFVILTGCGNESVGHDLSSVPAGERPNILWIVAEDMCQRIGAFGDSVASTPRLDRLASEGVLFPNSFATSGVCAPSRSAMITGVHQNTLGTQHMRTKPAFLEEPRFRIAYEAVPPPHVKALPELLRASGYYTVNNSKTDYQFGEPFSIWDESGPTAHWRNRPEGTPFFAYFTLLTTHESTLWPLDHEPQSLLEFFIVLWNHILLAGRKQVTDPGDVYPSGRLPSTWPRSEADLPAFINNQSQVEYGYYHGYLHVDREGIEPRFPLGYGLDYTSFEYGNLTLSESILSPEGTLEIGVDVTNTGAVAGEEVVQLYVSPEGSRVDRPVKALKGFEKVHLAPGETRRILLGLAAEDLGFYDVQLGDWEVERISYTARVGSSS